MNVEFDRKRVLGFSSAWVNNDATYPRQGTVPSEFERCAARYPDSIAVELASTDGARAEALTYAELSARSDCVAHAIVEHGVQPGDRVVFALDRSVNIAVVMLGILKAGAVYVPLDLSYPDAHLSFMVRDTAAKLAIVSENLKHRLPDSLTMESLEDRVQVLLAEQLVEQTAKSSQLQLPELAATDPAYIIYTSGSTGTPKGVVIPHRGILRLVCGASYARLGADRIVLQMAPVSFDAATFEIWGPLLNGGRCVFYPASGLPEFEQLRAVLRKSRITTAWLTSSLFNSIVDHDVTILDSVEELLVGGEALSVAHIRAASAALGAQLINGYGPTESTTFTCCYWIPGELPEDLASLPIGRPIENTAVAILDPKLDPVLPGEVGELCIAGDGLALGYWNRAELTRERFVDHADAPGGRFYRTGDLVRQLPSGHIEFLGRNDGQVKLHGHRIELGEIEHALRSHPQLQDAVAGIDETTDGSKRLASWVVPVNCTDVPSVDGLRTYLGERLPPYMVPAIFATITELPLTANGKLDRNALPPPERKRPTLEQAYVAPRGELERYVASTWSEVLGVDRVGRHDRFFELGGTSLMAVSFLERLYRERQVRLSVAAFFDGPTVANIVKILEEWKFPKSDDTVRSRRSYDVGTDERIAIVGLSGRFPGAGDVRQFWDMLLAGRSGRVDITRQDLEAAGEDPSLLDDPDYVAAAFPLDHAEDFDAEFFGIAPRAAQLMDPQQRVLLECAWSALEDAGYNPQTYDGRIGIFGGVGRNAYLLNNLMSHDGLRKTAADYNMLIGNERDFPCAHIAFRIGSNGPAVTVQTACSTSGVAIHMAAQSLLRGESDLALAGGAKVLSPNRVGYVHVEGGPLAADGYVRAFDAKANGMVRGSGAALVVLKRLDDAIADGDHIYSVLLGSAVNNDGAARAGFTAPSASGQEEVIADAHRAAGIEADSVSLIEAHGTGTVLGDPIEVEGLTRAFRTTTVQRGFCALGSVKTNIGHLDAGATAAGVVKVALALKHECIPPSLNYTNPNPQIDFAASPFYVASEVMEWKRGGKPRRAGVSSFGLGGTNAHLVIEEAPQLKTSNAGPDRGYELLVLSARTKTALAKRATDLADWLERHDDAELADVAYTLRVGRRRFEQRMAIVCKCRKDAIAKLRNTNPRDVLRNRHVAEAAPTTFMFPGGGTQYVGMARDHYKSEPAFRDALDACDAHFKKRTGQSLIELIYDNDGNLDAPAVALPTLFAIEYAMASLWRSWGIAPTAMIGHSMGEYTAACIAGVFSMTDALDVVLCRGRLFETLDGGSMLSVPLPETDLRGRLGTRLSIAAVNRADQCVVSGPVDDIEALAVALESEDIETRRVHINVAAHSSMVDPILEEFGRQLRKIEMKPPALPFVSNVTGDWISDDEATDPEYWVRHLRSTVRFADGIATLLQDPERIFLETGPGQALSTLVRQHSGRGVGHDVIATLRHPQEDEADQSFLLGAAARFWLAGGDIDWAAFECQLRRRVSLPTYPFERKRYWIDPAKWASGETEAIETLDAPESAREIETAGEGDALPASRRERILTQLTTIIHELSGLPHELIDPHATFLELGFDSLFLTQANAAFRKAFKVKLTTRQLIESTPGLDALAEHLDGVLADGVDFGTPQAAKSLSGTPLPVAQTSAEGPWQPVEKKSTASKDLTPAQVKHIDDLIAATNARTPQAKASTQASRGVLADPRTVQGFRSRWKEMVYPVLSDRAEGSKVWDVDGNEYIDLVCGYGVTFFGHRPKFITKAIHDQLEQTLAIGPQSVLAGEVAELVSDMTGMERVAFCNTGSEAVLAAVRMARTVTGKSKIAKFDGHYHGIFDEMQVRAGGRDGSMTLPSAPGIPQEAIANTVILKYGDEQAFDTIREQAEDLALVLVEPVRSRNPDFQPADYLRQLRKVTEELGIPLLFDEIVTGFRSHPGGAQALFGVRADLATYGKVVGGGLPIGIVSGRAAYMDALDGGVWNFGDGSTPTADMTWFAGTFVRHPMALASTKATLEHLKHEGPGLQERMNARAADFKAKLNAFLKRVSAPIKVEQFSSVLRITFTKHQDYADLLFFHLRNRGILTYEGRPAFLTTAHSDDDLQRIYGAFVESVGALQEVGLLEGCDPDAPRTLPLTPGQQEIWLTAKFGHDASCSYNLCSTLLLNGPLDESALRYALDDLTARHQSLRAVPDNDGTTQTILQHIKMPVTVEDLSGLEDDAQSKRVELIESREVTSEFDLVNGPLVRCQILRLADEKHLVLLTVHHLIADGWSCGVLLRDLGELYAARCDDRKADLEPGQQLTDFVHFLDQPEQREARQDARDYWLDLYKGDLPITEFPGDRSRPAVRDYKAKRFEISVDRELAANLRNVARDNGTTLFATLIGGFAAYFSRLTGAPETPIGFSVAGQPLLGGGGLVGHCVNFLPLRWSTKLDGGFQDHLRGIGGAVLDALEHQNFDFGSFIQELSPQRDASRSPLVSVGVNLDPSSKGVTFADLEVQAGSVGRAYESLDMFLNFVETGSDLELQCTYSTALFDEETMRRRMAEYLRFLAAASAAPSEPLQDIDLLDNDDREKLLVTWNDTARDYPRDSSIAEIFKSIAQNYADSTALVVPGDRQAFRDEERVSYAQLDQQSDHWALRLKEAGVKRGDFVAILLPSSAELIIAILATLKAGAAYLPIEPDTPAPRRQFIIDDGDAKAVLTLGELPDDLASTNIPVLRMDANVVLTDVRASECKDVDGGDPAYMIYTSGSTGTPKGVVVPHRAVAQLVIGSDFARLDDSRVLLQLAPASFDAATFEIWGALLHGATLVLPPGERLTELAALDGLLKSTGVTTLWLTASLFNMIVDEDVRVLGGVEEILTGGEALSPAHVRRAQEALPDAKIINGYGPTENTTFTCCHPIPRGLDQDVTSVPIGRPIANTRVYIVDQNRKLAPIGVPGELFVGGDGLAIGYWNRDDLNALSFLTDEVPGAGARGDNKLYRTGDYCRFLSDGRIEFLGRKDDQTKIRGFRIEPGEVEAALLELDGVKQAAVLVEGLPQNRQLVAFVAVETEQPDPAHLIRKLRERLPKHMVPTRIDVLPALPLSPNGKVDRQALPGLLGDAGRKETNTKPATDTEIVLATMWSTLLNRRDIGINENFFELGGHSLLAVQLFDRIRRRFDVDLPISTLFLHPTIGDVAAIIDETMNSEEKISASDDIDAEWDTSTIIHPGPGTHALPLFIVGGLGGNVNNLVDLGAALGAHRPVIGFQSRGILGHAPHESIEAMASENIRYMRQHQPVGPYHLAGYSAGAQTAFEMARQLVAVGEAVESLVVLDTYAPSFAQDLGGDGGYAVPIKLTFQQWLENEWRLLSGHGGRYLLQRVGAKLRRLVLRDEIVGLLGLEDSSFARIRRTEKAWMRAAQTYRAGAYSGPIKLILSRALDLKEEILFENHPLLGWDKFVDPGMIERQVVDSSHLEMARGEHASTMADMIEHWVGARNSDK